MGRDHTAERERGDPVGDQIVIDRRFCGPPDSGNGGYVAGLLANALGETAGALGAPSSSAALRAASSSTSRNSGSDVEAAEVTLRRPAPFDKPLDVRRTDDGIELLDGRELIAEARATTGAQSAPASSAKQNSWPLGVPPMPDFDIVLEAAARGEAKRPTMQYNDCFVCGSNRAEGDGLRIFASEIDSDGSTAGIWTPGAAFAEGDGVVRPEFVAAALDCPGGFVYIRPDLELLLGRYAVAHLAPVCAGESYAVVGWPGGEDGRKRYVRSALYAEDGSPVAVARATWITI